METLLNAVSRAAVLLAMSDATVLEIALRSLQVSLTATAASLAIGIPLGAPG